MLKIKAKFLLMLLMPLSAMSYADQPARSQTPIISGTKLTFPTMDCSAGLAVNKTGFFDNVTQYQRAVRYVVVAGHCGEVNDPVLLGHNSVGKMVWKSGKSDLGLVKIEPSKRASTHCSAPSTGMTCSIIVTYDPLAKGRVFVTQNGANVAISGVGNPGPNEVFCTSGYMSGVNCSWGKINAPSTGNYGTHIENSDTAQTVRANVEDGDSGGAVTSFGVTRKIYGIISMKGHPFGASPTNMKYVAISHFFAEQPGYAIAPSN